MDTAALIKSDSAQTAPIDGFPLDRVLKAAPLVAVGFAFAFDVGYFYSIDIGWFSFFTISEHTEFALRALPVALAGTVLFLLLFFVHDLKTLLEPVINRWSDTLIDLRYLVAKRPRLCADLFFIGTAVVFIIYYLLLINNVQLAISALVGGVAAVNAYDNQYFPRFRIVKSLWIGSLIGSIVYVAIFRGYYVLGTSVLALAAATFIYWQADDCGWKSDKLKIQFRALFIFLNLMVFSFFVGFMTSMSWYIERQYDHQSSLVTFDDGECLKGQMMHPGEKALLFYQRKTEGQEPGVRLFSRDHIRSVRVCDETHKCNGELVADLANRARIKNARFPYQLETMPTPDDWHDLDGYHQITQSWQSKTDQWLHRVDCQ